MAKVFTLDEATRLLPRLRELLPELQEAKAAVDRLQQELAGLSRAAMGDGHLLMAQMERKRREVKSITERMNASVEELNSLGCELKGVDEGLIDFPAEREGRTVYLCWRVGEDAIEWWHELDTGFAGRQPL